VFEVLPVAAAVGGAIFCVHGGLSPDLRNIEEINKISRPLAVLTGITSDMLWSDPCSFAHGFEPSERGLGYIFDLETAIQFLEMNKLQMIVRSHESCPNGMEWPFGEKNQKVLTIFSTTDYCGSGNAGVVARFAENLVFERVLFPVLSADARRRRRVFVPLWLLNDKTMPPPIAQLESDLDSQPEDCPWGAEFATTFGV
jgi:diadenosine tetraphosphatase ApaH/serine/threonine PP2A family protein phosphatase